MAQAPRRNPPRERAQSAVPNMLPVFATLGVVVLAALVVALMTQEAKDKAAEGNVGTPAPAGAPSDVFSDIDTNPERFRRPGRSSGSGPTTTHAAPPGLADAPIFAEARRVAQEGAGYVDAALATEKAGDDEGWRTNATAARERYERALEMTAEWHDEISRKWGSNDAQLKRIDAEIGGWQKQLGRVRKAR